MRISPISNVFNVRKQQKNKSVNFNGLWGKTTYRTDYDSGLSVPKVETVYYYYPFRDESKSDVTSVKSDNSSANIVDGNKYVIKDCRVGYTLPFDEADYDEYLDADYETEITKLVRDVHKNVSDKFKNRDYAQNQESAANPVISKKLPK